MLDHRRVDIGWVTGSVLVVALSLSYQAHAATISFTDQATFLTQLQAPSFEGFESHVVGGATPSVSAAGFTMSSGSIQIRNTSLGVRLRLKGNSLLAGTRRTTAISCLFSKIRSQRSA